MVPVVTGGVDHPSQSVTLLFRQEAAKGAGVERRPVHPPPFGGTIRFSVQVIGDGDGHLHSPSITRYTQRRPWGPIEFGEYVGP